MTGLEGETILHASAVAVEGRGVLILGAAGRGKTGLALGLMAQGASLIADDRTSLVRRGDALVAFAPRTILGLIEARGIGILRADPAPPTPVALVVDLDREEPDRIPPMHTWSCAGWCGPLIHGAGNPHLIPGILQFLRGGRSDS